MPLFKILVISILITTNILVNAQEKSKPIKGVDDTVNYLEKADSIQTKNNNAIFGIHTIDPSYPGGIEAFYEYINKNLVYPKWEREQKIQGRVTTNFTVEATGKISDIRILRTVAGSKNFDTEAIRLLKNMPNWIPGKKGDDYVRVSYSVPILFSYEKLDVKKILKEDSNYIFTHVDTKPIFQKGNASLNNFIDNSILSLSWVKGKNLSISSNFIVEKDGKLSNITLKGRNISDQEKKELITILKKMPKWTPAKIGDINVRAYQKLHF